MALLTIKELTISFGGAPVLNSISFAIERGEVVALAGESGSGKSMTALAVMGLLPPGAVMSGEIVFDGSVISDLDEKARCVYRGKKIGMIFQEPMTALNPVMTIGEQIAEVVRLHRKTTRADANAAAREMLDRVGLHAPRFTLGHYPHQLSGGQRQRVAIAIALALRPDLIIADEPTTALDVSTQAEILDLLRRLVREDGASLVFITHDLGVVAEIADRVVVMNKGEIVETGEVEKVFSTPAHPYTAMLIENADHIPTRNEGERLHGAPALVVSNIVREYPGKQEFLKKSPALRAVNNVSLRIDPGESVGLVGGSGCGKSTLLRTIVGLDRPQAGEVRIFVEAFPAKTSRRTRDLRRHLQVVFQDPFGSFDPRWRVERIIAENFNLFADRPVGAAARLRVEAALAQVGLAPADADKYPHEFSGGQRQRIAIARALITEPSVIALDEAVSALDVTVRAKILDLLADLSDRLGVSYLFVTHDLSVVRAVTDRVLVMQAGEIVEQGETDKVFNNPAHPYTRMLIDAAPVLTRALENRKGRKPGADSEKPGN